MLVKCEAAGSCMGFSCSYYENLYGYAFLFPFSLYFVVLDRREG